MAMKHQGKELWRESVNFQEKGLNYQPHSAAVTDDHQPRLAHAPSPEGSLSPRAAERWVRLVTLLGIHTLELQASHDATGRPLSRILGLCALPIGCFI